MMTLGVADGVGGWADSGVDPSVFSQALMRYSFLASAPPPKHSTQPRPTPTEILQQGYDGVTADAEVKAGQSALSSRSPQRGGRARELGLHPASCRRGHRAHPPALPFAHDLRSRL